MAVRTSAGVHRHSRAFRDHAERTARSRSCTRDPGTDGPIRSVTSPTVGSTTSGTGSSEPSTIAGVPATLTSAKAEPGVSSPSCCARRTDSRRQPKTCRGDSPCAARSPTRWPPAPMLRRRSTPSLPPTIDAEAPQGSRPAATPSRRRLERYRVQARVQTEVHSPAHSVGRSKITAPSQSRSTGSVGRLPSNWHIAAAVNIPWLC